MKTIYQIQLRTIFFCLLLLMPFSNGFAYDFREDTVVIDEKKIVNDSVRFYNQTYKTGKDLLTHPLFKKGSKEQDFIESKIKEFGEANRLPVANTDGKSVTLKLEKNVKIEMNKIDLKNRSFEVNNTSIQAKGKSLAHIYQQLLDALPSHQSSGFSFNLMNEAHAIVPLAGVVLLAEIIGEIAIAHAGWRAFDLVELNAHVTKCNRVMIAHGKGKLDLNDSEQVKLMREFILRSEELSRLHYGINWVLQDTDAPKKKLNYCIDKLKQAMNRSNGPSGNETTTNSGAAH